MYKFKPILKTLIWGTESWVLSGVPGSESVVSEGPDKGRTLTDVYGPYFPLLIKFIDARRDLSIQVHPGEELAQKRHSCHGKTEMWYVVDCEPGASLYFGVNRALTKEEFKKRIEDNTLTDVLYKADVKKGDVFFIQSGTIHAIGAGILICEIQQNSNTTYRVYDYGRRGADGKLRELHIDKAIDVSKLTPSDTSDKQGKPEEIPGGTKCALASCPYFTTEKYVVDGEVEIDVTTRLCRRSVSVLAAARLSAARTKWSSSRRTACLYRPAAAKLRLMATARW